MDSRQLFALLLDEIGLAGRQGISLNALHDRLLCRIRFTESCSFTPDAALFDYLIKKLAKCGEIRQETEPVRQFYASQRLMDRSIGVWSDTFVVSDNRRELLEAIAKTRENGTTTSELGASNKVYPLVEALTEFGLISSRMDATSGVRKKRLRLTKFTQDKTSVINDWISKLETALLPLLHKQFGLPYFETMYALGCYEEAVVLAVKNALKTGTHGVRLKHVRTKAPPRSLLKRRRPDNSDDDEDDEEPRDLETAVEEPDKPEDAGKDVKDDDANFTWIAYIRQGATPRMPGGAVGGDMMAATEDGEDDDDRVDGGCPAFTLPLMFQVYRLIALSQQEGVTSTQLRLQLGISTKSIAKVIKDVMFQRQICVTKKAVGRTSVQVFRLPEFSSPAIDPSEKDMARVEWLQNPFQPRDFEDSGAPEVVWANPSEPPTRHITDKHALLMVVMDSLLAEFGLFGQSHVIDEMAARLPQGSPRVDRRTVLSLAHHKQSLGQLCILRFDDAIHPRMHVKGVTVFCSPELADLSADDAVHRLAAVDAVWSQRRQAGREADGSTDAVPAVGPQKSEEPDEEPDVPVTVTVAGTRIPVIKLVGTLAFMRKQRKTAGLYVPPLKPEVTQIPAEPSPLPVADKPLAEGNGVDEPPSVLSSLKKRKPRVKQHFPGLPPEADVPGGTAGRSSRFSDFAEPFVVVWTTLEDARLLAAIDAAAEAPLFHTMATLTSFSLDGIRWDAVRDATFLPIPVCRERAVRLMNSLLGDEALSMYKSTIRQTAQGRQKIKHRLLAVTTTLIGDQPLLSDTNTAQESTQFGLKDDDLTPYQRLLVSKVLQVSMSTGPSIDLLDGHLSPDDHRLFWLFEDVNVHTLAVVLYRLRQSFWIRPVSVGRTFLESNSVTLLTKRLLIGTSRLMALQPKNITQTVQALVDSIEGCNGPPWSRTSPSMGPLHVPDPENGGQVARLLSQLSSGQCAFHLDRKPPEAVVDAEMLQRDMPVIVVADSKEKVDDATEDIGGVEVVLKQVMMHRDTIARSLQQPIKVYVDNNTPEDVLYHCYEPGVDMVLRPLDAKVPEAVDAPPPLRVEVTVDYVTEVEKTIRRAGATGVSASQLLTSVLFPGAMNQRVSALVQALSKILGEHRTAIVAPGHQEPVYVPSICEHLFLEAGQRTAHSGSVSVGVHRLWDKNGTPSHIGLLRTIVHTVLDRPGVSFDELQHDLLMLSPSELRTLLRQLVADNLIRDHVGCVPFRGLFVSPTTPCDHYHAEQVSALAGNVFATSVEFGSDFTADGLKQAAMCQRFYFASSDALVRMCDLYPIQTPAAKVSNSGPKKRARKSPAASTTAEDAVEACV